jgi:hypothetical protein
MQKTLIQKLLLLLAALFLPAGFAMAQAVKAISVSGTASYTDHVSLAQDSRDMDVMVKFIFDEPNNKLTVSVLSYRNLFVFQEPARYGSVVRCNKLHPELLPYVADNGSNARFKLSKSLKKSLSKPLGKHVFQRWIEYEGLQPQPVEYKMVNDYIEQAFDILDKRSTVSVTLRELFLLDAVKKKADSYVLSQGKDLNLKYQITIVRNPCLGMEDEIEAARKLTAAVKKAYGTFLTNYPKGEVSSEDALKTFRDTRTALLSLYPVRENVSTCPDLSNLVKEYNQYVDSISRFSLRLRSSEESAWDDGKPLDVKLLYTQTRQLDKSVARWLVSTDELEKSDLIDECQDIIKDMSAMIRTHNVVTKEEQKAVQAFRQAETYFKKTCRQ